jgi:hypothetical protein
MNRRFCLLAFATALAFRVTPAAAQQAAPSEIPTAGGARQIAYGAPGLAGVPGRLVISAERVVSVSSWSWTIEATGAAPGALEGSGTNVGFLWSAQSQVPGGAINAINPFGTPRIAADIFVIPNLTIGGSFGYATTSGSVKQTAPTASEEVTAPSTTAIVFAPRVGAAFSLSEWVSIWARAGITYSHCSVEQEPPKTMNGTKSVVPTVSLSWDQMAVSLDPMLVITPTAHFGIAIGPTFDIPVSDSVELTGATAANEVHFQLANYGVSGGVLGYF